MRDVFNKEQSDYEKKDCALYSHAIENSNCVELCRDLYYIKLPAKWLRQEREKWEHREKKKMGSERKRAERKGRGGWERGIKVRRTL